MHPLPAEPGLLFLVAAACAVLGLLCLAAAAITALIGDRP